MGAVLGRNFKASKFKTLAKLAISRVAILKNQRQVRYSLAKSDVLQLLNLGHQERALLRVEHMIEEQNLIDVFVKIEDYCYLLIDRIMMLKEKECHEEVKEAISSLIFASSRCGEFPELQEIREIFKSRFGRDFVARAVELGSNCGVNPKIIQNLSMRRPSLESKLKVLKDTAAQNGIVLDLVEDAPAVVEETLNDCQKQKQKQKQQESYKSSTEHHDEDSIELNADEKLPESVKATKKYRDAAAAALEAFESAAYAAAAARAAVNLLKSKSLDNDED